MTSGGIAHYRNPYNSGSVSLGKENSGADGYSKAMAVWPYSVAIFDLDGTLFDHYYSLRNAMRALYLRWGLEAITGCSLEFFIKRHEDALTQAYDLYLNGDISNDSVSKETFRIFFADLGVNAQLINAEGFAADFKLEYHRHLRATPGSVDVLNKLREAGITIAVLTNGPSVQQRQKLLAIDLLPHIDHLITSEDLGFAKPAQESLSAGSFPVGSRSTALFDGRG
jgi:FMN phosphatase YigB (HAD superfamily)